MQMNKLVTVIVPVYNAAEFLCRSIDSVLNQTYENLEIILVDDGSTDNSLHICTEYEAKCSRIKSYHKQNEGVSSARNLGISSARGDYIYFMDADDYLHPNTISSLVKQLEENDLEIVISSYSEDHEGKVTNRIRPNSNLEILSYEDTIRRIGFDENWGGFVWNKLYTRSIIGNHRFEPSIHLREDLVFCYSVIDHNTRVGFYNECLYYYCVWHNSSSKQGMTDRRLSLIYANEYELRYFQNMLNNEELINYTGRRLVGLYYEFYWRTILAKEVTDKKYWLDYIGSQLRRYKKVYPAFGLLPWRRKVKAIVVALCIFFTFSKDSMNGNAER